LRENRGSQGKQMNAIGKFITKLDELEKSRFGIVENLNDSITKLGIPLFFKEGDFIYEK
jgi:hypothetical protein